MRRIATAIVLSAPLIFWGCATARVGQLGPLPNGEPLVTLVVSADRSVVEHECDDVPSLGRVFGCERTRTVSLPDGRRARAVKIVRYAQALPSAMTFEIDIHELCHAIASVQGLADPCHVGTAGTIQSVAPGRRVLR